MAVETPSSGTVPQPQPHQHHMPTPQQIKAQLASVLPEAYFAYLDKLTIALKEQSASTDKTLKNWSANTSNTLSEIFARIKEQLPVLWSQVYAKSIEYPPLGAFLALTALLSAFPVLIYALFSLVTVLSAALVTSIVSGTVMGSGLVALAFVVMGNAFVAANLVTFGFGIFYAYQFVYNTLVSVQKNSRDYLSKRAQDSKAE